MKKDPFFKLAKLADAIRNIGVGLVGAAFAALVLQTGIALIDVFITAGVGIGMVLVGSVNLDE